MLSRLLVAAGAGLVGLLGLAHLLFTFRGDRLAPRDAGVRRAMESAHPQMTSATTLWKMWIGFNASHGLGAVVVGVVYAHLALAHFDLLLGSLTLQLAGAGMIGGWVALGRRYWFRDPFLASMVALLLFAGGLIAGHLL